MAGVIAGVISVADFLADYIGDVADEAAIFGLLKGPNGEELIAERVIERAIRTNAASVEDVLEVKFAATRYACRPDIGDTPLVEGDDYDVEDDPYDWIAGQTSLRGGKLTLRHGPVRSIERIRMLYGSRVLYELPTTWANLKKATATLQFLVDGSGTLNQQEAVATSLVALDDFMAQDMTRGRIPNFWGIDYTAGLATVPDDVIAAVSWRAAAEVLALADAKANKLAVQSQNISQDGVSRSQSTSSAQPGGRFSRLLEQPRIKRWLDDDYLLRFTKQRLRPPPVL